MDDYSQIISRTETTHTKMMDILDTTCMMFESGLDQLHALAEEKEGLQGLINDLTAKNQDLAKTCDRLGTEVEKGAELMRNIQQMYDKVVIERDALMEENHELRKALDKVHRLPIDTALSINRRPSSSKAPHYNMPTMEHFEESGVQTADNQDATEDNKSPVADFSIFLVSCTYQHTTRVIPIPGQGRPV